MAWRYICFHRFKTILLVACIALTVSLPVSIELLLRQFDKQIVARADATPLVVGRKGSRLDLTLSALYLNNKDVEPIKYGDSRELSETGYAKAIPLHLGHTAQRYPIVGTSLEYFPYRELVLSEGNLFRRLGDCVVGAQVASKLELSVGDSIKSDRLNSLDIASNPPLYMNIAGILERTNSADDKAVFVDLKTAWVVDGLGHGHEDLSEVDDETKILKRDGDTTIASAGVTNALRITPETVNSFHFHGDTSDFPISAIIAIPPDVRSRDLLLGRYQSDKQIVQLVEPGIVVRDLMDLVFRAKQFFDANAILISLATFLLLVMVLALSLKLREREMQTMFKIGCSKSIIIQLQAAELGLIALASLVLIGAAVMCVSIFASGIVQSLLIEG